LEQEEKEGQGSKDITWKFASGVVNYARCPVMIVK
jgi:hypothetical protein